MPTKFQLKCILSKLRKQYKTKDIWSYISTHTFSTEEIYRTEKLCRQTLKEHVSTLKPTEIYPVLLVEDSCVSKCFPYGGGSKAISEAASKQKVQIDDPFNPSMSGHKHGRSTLACQGSLPMWEREQKPEFIPQVRSWWNTCHSSAPQVYPFWTVTSVLSCSGLTGLNILLGRFLLGSWIITAQPFFSTLGSLSHCFCTWTPIQVNHLFKSHKQLLSKGHSLFPFSASQHEKDMAQVGKGLCN